MRSLIILIIVGAAAWYFGWGFGRAACELRHRIPTAELRPHSPQPMRTLSPKRERDI